MRLIKTVHGSTCNAKVYRNAEWQEYVVKFFALDGTPRGDSHHDDRQDALDTACWQAEN